MRITIRAAGDESSATTGFSSENYTSSISYDPKSDSTVIVFELKRLSADASVTLTLNAYSGKALQIWVNADETGNYYDAQRSVLPSFLQPYFTYLSVAATVGILVFVFVELVLFVHSRRKD